MSENKDAAVEADRREYLDTLKLARAIVNGRRRDNPPEDSVEADRQSRMPSDGEIDRLSHGFALQYQDHVRGFARALLSRYGSGQPEETVDKACKEADGCPTENAVLKRFWRAHQDQPDVLAAEYERGRHDGWAAGWDQAHGQPAASAEPPKLTDDEIERLVIQLGVTWKEDAWKIEDADLHPMVRALLYRYTTAPVAVQPVVTDEMVTRFLGWHLPQDFAPDAGISFNPSPDPHSWPVGTNLLTDPQARAMLEYVLQSAPAAAQAQPSGNAGELSDEREAFVAWLSGEFPRAWPAWMAERAWDNNHVAAMAWRVAQPSAQDREDAERWREVAERFDQAKTSACERVLEALGLDGADAAKSLDLVIDAARAAKGADHD